MSSLSLEVGYLQIPIMRLVGSIGGEAKWEIGREEELNLLNSFPPLRRKKKNGIHQDP